MTKPGSQSNSNPNANRDPGASGRVTIGLDVVEQGGLRSAGTGSTGSGSTGDGSTRPAGSATGSSTASRPMIQVMFACANQYTRVMRSADGTNYRAMCPKCGKAMRFDVGDGGTDQRTFFLSCR